MPRVESQLLGEPPKGPHLALEHETGMWTAIPAAEGNGGKGAHLAIIENPARHDGVWPAILVSVGLKKLVLKCGCGQQTCTLRLEFKSKRLGFHPKSQRNEASRA